MKRLVLIGAALALAAVSIFLLREGPPSFAPPTPGSTPGFRGLSLKPGDSAHFSFVLEHRGRVPISAELPMELELDLAGELRLLGLGRDDGRPQVEFTLTSLERSGFRMGDGDLLGAATLIGAQALAVYSNTGALLEVRFAPDAPPEADRLLHLLVLESQLELDSAPRWSRPEHHSLGEAEMAYTRTPAGVRRSVERHQRFGGLEAEELPKLQAEAETLFDFASDGSLRRLQDSWTYEGPFFGGHKRFSLERRDATRAEPQSWVGRARRYAEARGPGETKTSTRSLESALIQRAEGLTVEQCLVDLITHEAGGRMPDHERWLWRASGLLRLHPELALLMVPLLSRRTMSSTGRGLVLDLLAHVGHTEAQAALRTAMALPAVRSDPDFHLLYQRFSFVTEPDPETRAFVQAGLEAARPEHKNAAAHTLGSVAGSSYRSGDREEALALTEPLLEALEKEMRPEKQAELLGALGNAGLPEHAELLLGFASSPHPEVRYQMAGSLRKLEGEAVTRSLVDLSADPSGAPIQRRALSTLGQRTVEDSAFDELCRRVQRGEIAPESQGILVTLLAQQLPDPRARAALEYLLQAPDTMTDVRARIRSVLSG